MECMSGRVYKQLRNVESNKENTQNIANIPSKFIRNNHSSFTYGEQHEQNYTSIITAKIMFPLRILPVIYTKTRSRDIITMCNPHIKF